jgi:hypothetical protein
MTQDQYGQARNAGYGNRGDVVEDDTGDNPSDEGKPMTRFQKVASALRGDRPDRDETDEDEGLADTVPPGAAGSGMAAGSGVMTPGQGAQAEDPSWVTHPNEAGAASTPGSRDALPGQEAEGMTAGRQGEPAATAGTQPGDYWEVPGAREDQVVAVTSLDAPVTDTDADPLGRQDETVDETRPDLAATETFTGDPVAGNGVPGGIAGDQAGAATISDAPVTQQDAAEAAGGAGQHAAAAPAEELHPGEATGTLDDLGELAYGNLLPDATVFTEQWQQIQFRFVDDPQASVTEAAEVVAQVTAKLEAAIQERQRAIEARQQAIQERQRSLRGRWGEGTQADTETLRETLRMYRAFLDQLIGPKA